MLHVVTCHFNPHGFQKPRDNFRRFRDALKQPVTAVEASFDGRFYCDAEIEITADPARHLMWQKERLLNIALESLPPEADKVAWIDADILFDRADWAATAEHLLERFPLVQLFETASMLGPDDELLCRHAGRVAFDRKSTLTRAQSLPLPRKPGFAWAARREALGVDLLPESTDPARRVGGLFDLDIAGGGDSSMVSAWTGRRSDWILGQMNNAFRDAYQQWASDAWSRVRNQIGFVPGNVRHLYHGSRKNRQYGDRIRGLRKADYTPAEDIALDDNGLWRWASEKPEMHDRVQRYFAKRSEDT